MANDRLTLKAVEDLVGIWNYTFDNWSESQADKYYQFLLNSCQKLANDSSHAKQYEISIENVWGFKFGEHIIFFQKIGHNEIEVVRILHGMMDLKSKF